MSLFTDIRRAIEIRLVATAGFPASGQRSFENVTFKPTIGTIWARGMLRPTTQRQAGFTSSGLEIRTGDYLVGLFSPLETGSATADVLADAVRDQFKTPLTLTQNTTAVTILSADRKTALTEPNWYHVPIIITWTSLSN